MTSNYPNPLQIMISTAKKINEELDKILKKDTSKETNIRPLYDIIVKFIDFFSNNTISSNEITRALFQFIKDLHLILITKNSLQENITDQKINSNIETIIKSIDRICVSLAKYDNLEQKISDNIEEINGDLKQAKNLSDVNNTSKLIIKIDLILDTLYILSKDYISIVIEEYSTKSTSSNIERSTADTLVSESKSATDTPKDLTLDDKKFGDLSPSQIAPEMEVIKENLGDQILNSQKPDVQTSGKIIEENLSSEKLQEPQLTGEKEPSEPSISQFEEKGLQSEEVPVTQLLDEKEPAESSISQFAEKGLPSEEVPVTKLQDEKEPSEPAISKTDKAALLSSEVQVPQPAGKIEPAEQTVSKTGEEALSSKEVQVPQLLDEKKPAEPAISHTNGEAVPSGEYQGTELTGESEPAGQGIRQIGGEAVPSTEGQIPQIPDENEPTEPAISQTGGEAVPSGYDQRTELTGESEPTGQGVSQIGGEAVPSTEGQIPQIPDEKESAEPAISQTGEEAVLSGEVQGTKLTDESVPAGQEIRQTVGEHPNSQEISSPELTSGAQADGDGRPTEARIIISTIEEVEDFTEINKETENEYNTIFEKSEPAILLKIKPNATGNSSKILREVDQLIKSAKNIEGNYKQPLDYSFDATIEDHYRITDCVPNNFIKDHIGLSVNLDNHKGSRNAGYVNINGQPNNVGYAKTEPLKIIAVVDSKKIEYRIFTKDFYIVPDPKTMWEDLPFVDDQGYPALNTASDSKELTDINKIVVAASVRGRSHAHEAKPRDDYFYFDCDNEYGWKVFAVSDGAGSAKFSRKGSEIACETSVKTFLDQISIRDLNRSFEINEPVVRDWKSYFERNIGKPSLFQHNTEFRRHLDECMYTTIWNVFDKIKNEADNLNKKKNENGLNIKGDITIRDYHATLMFLAFKKFSFGYFIISFWIGDGAFALYKWNHMGEVIIFGEPDSGEFAGQTRFVTMASEINPDSVKEKTRYVIADDFDTILMATDGISDPFFDSENEFKTYTAWNHFIEKSLKEGDDNNKGCPELFSDTATLEEKTKSLLDWCNFYISRYHDDRTIIIIK